MTPSSRAVWVLGVTTTIGYGSLFYSFSILAQQLLAAFDWQFSALSMAWDLSGSAVYVALGVGLVAGGLLSPKLGHLIDVYGARRMLSIGSAVAALGLVCIGCSRQGWQLFLAIVVLEALSSVVLYEGAFTALVQVYGEGARKQMTQITLMAGFASSLFWPFIEWLLEFTDWRGAYLIMAAMHMLICLPLHWMLPDVQRQKLHPEQHAVQGKQDAAPLPSSDASYPHWATLASSLSVVGFVISAVQIHIFTLMTGVGIAMKEAVWIATLIGPAQVVARVTEMSLAKHWHPALLGCFSVVAKAVGLLCLLLIGWLYAVGMQSTTALMVLGVAFSICFGVGQGLNYIVKGALPLKLYGKQGYGGLTGRLNRYRMLASAVAMWLVSVWVGKLGSVVSVGLLVAMLVIAAVMLWRLYRMDATPSTSDL